MSEHKLLTFVLAASTLAVLSAWLPWRGLRPTLIACCGAGLLAFVSPLSLGVLGTATLVTFVLQRNAWVSKQVLIGAILILACAYLGLQTLSDHKAQSVGTRVILPLGMAFYVLRLIHYLIESYKGTLRPHRLDEYLCYQFLPSTLAAGPIHRFDELLRDMRRKRWDFELFAYGAQRILYGLAKLIVIGNYLLGEELAPLAAAAAARSSAGTTYLSLVLFWLNLYVEFSGYSDVAIGFGALMGFRLRENFNYSLVARNIADFWQRWHMSLSSWCRDYVFMPVLSSTRRPTVAVVSSMVVLGLWHDTSLRYILWGAYHGAGIAAFRWFDAKAGARIRAFSPAPAIAWRLCATALTLNFVLFSFYATRAVERLIVGG